MSPALSRTGRTYVLVHGAWFGGWVWQPVAGLLRALGHTVYAPSLTGLGDRNHLLRPGINLEAHADDIVNLLDMEDLRDVVLVGWSYGGMVITDVLARAASRVGAVVYMDAMMPERGRAHASYTDWHPMDAIISLMVQGRDIPAPEARILGVDDPQLIQHIDERLSLHPTLTFLSPSQGPAERLDIPYTYVLAGAFAKVSSTFSQFYEAFVDGSWGTAHVIDAGHVLMLTAPGETATVLDSVESRTTTSESDPHA